MTQIPEPTLITPLDVATVYAAALCLSGFGGLFAPGALMAARMRAAAVTPASPPQG